MSARLSSYFQLILLLTCTGLLSTPTLANVPPATQEWSFRVFLDQKEIGFHDYRVIDEGDKVRVVTEASFDVRILFINAFRYRHRNVETWDADCLTGIDASTDANGKQLKVEGERREQEFVVKADGDESSLPACIMSFAYWNPQMLGQTRLLNSQTGEFEAIEVEARGDDTVIYADEPVPARRYDLLVKDKTVSLWYASDDGRWLALESPARGGRTIRYEPVLLPEATQFVDDAPLKVAGND